MIKLAASNKVYYPVNKKEKLKLKQSTKKTKKVQKKNTDAYPLRGDGEWDRKSQLEISFIMLGYNACLENVTWFL